MKVFAYGTLMGREGFREALGERAEALSFRPARLAGWRRIWNAYRDEWGGGVLNLERNPSGEVWGVLVDGLTETDMSHLDAQESTHLPRESVYVETETGAHVAAEIYWLRRGASNAAPSPRYQAVVLARAREAGATVLEDLRTGSVDAAGESRRLA
jgi:cation transport regulator ChaC